MRQKYPEMSLKKADIFNMVWGKFPLSAHPVLQKVAQCAVCVCVCVCFPVMSFKDLNFDLSCYFLLVQNRQPSVTFSS